MRDVFITDREALMPPMKSDRAASGFTLIELLVVIAIIAVLAAILFPVFARAREKARQSTCLNNQRQIATAIQMYVQDNNNTFFPDPGSRTWSTYVGASLSNKIFDCPSLAKTRGSSDRPAYGFNYGLFSTGIAKISNPSAALMTADYGMASPATNFAITNYDGQIDRRHDDGAIISCVDGHVARVASLGTKALGGFYAALFANNIQPFTGQVVLDQPTLYAPNNGSGSPLLTGTSSTWDSSWIVCSTNSNTGEYLLPTTATAYISQSGVATMSDVMIQSDVWSSTVTNTWGYMILGCFQPAGVTIPPNVGWYQGWYLGHTNFNIGTTRASSTPSFASTLGYWYTMYTTFQLVGSTCNVTTYVLQQNQGVWSSANNGGPSPNPSYITNKVIGIQTGTLNPASLVGNNYLRVSYTTWNSATGAALANVKVTLLKQR